MARSPACRSWRRTACSHPPATSPPLQRRSCRPHRRGSRRRPAGRSRRSVSARSGGRRCRCCRRAGTARAASPDAPDSSVLWHSSQARGRRGRSRAADASALRDQVGGHELGRDALGFLGRVVELDLDAVRVVEEKLEQRLAVGAPLVECHLLAAQVLEHGTQSGRTKRDVVDGAGAGATVLRRAAEVFLLDVVRLLRARADVHDVDVVHVHPVHREAEVGMRAALHAEHARVPVARGVDVVGRNQEVLYVRNGHALIYTARRSTMDVADAKRLTADGAKRIMATAIARAREGGVAVSVAIVDAGGHLMLLERMEGGRFHTVHSATTKAVCAASNRRATGSKGAVGQALDVTHALGLALAAGAERWTAMEGGWPIMAGGECIGAVGVAGGDWQTDERLAREAAESIK